MERRFVAPLIITIIILTYGIIFNCFSVLTFSPSSDLLPILPGNAYIDLWVMLFAPFGFLLLMYFIAPLQAPFLLKIHSLIKLKKCNYFVVPLEKKLTGFRIIWRSIYPGLFSINLAILISFIAQPFSNLIMTGVTSQAILIEVFAIFVGMPTACLVILPIWVIESVGIMSFLDVDKFKYRVTPDIESVGRFFSSLLKGYVGISTVFSYITILYSFLTAASDVTHYLIIFIDPFIIIIFFVPISGLLEYGVPKLRKKLLPKFEEKGIDIQPKRIVLEKVNNEKP
ncbi:MAG: hypothetical protein ACTSRB_16270 [Candidatus Helarchaeota archaeon]